MIRFASTLVTTPLVAAGQPRSLPAAAAGEDRAYYVFLISASYNIPGASGVLTIFSGGQPVYRRAVHGAVDLQFAGGLVLPANGDINIELSGVVGAIAALSAGYTIGNAI